VNIRSLRPDAAQEASAALLNNQLALKVNSAILKEVTEDQLRKAAADVLEVAERSLAGLANIINSIGGAAAGDWQKLKAILTEMIVKGGVLKGNSNLDVIAEFNAAAARAGIKPTDKLKAKFQELWKTGKYHAISGLATGVAGVLALVHGDNAWERLRAAGHLLDFVSWSHYYAQLFFYNQTRPNSGHWLEKVSGERGEFGNRLLSKIPIIKDFSNFGDKATAFQLSSLINQMSSGATYNLILSVLSSTDYDSLINQFVSDQRNLAAKKRALDAATTPAARQRAQQALDAAKEAAAQSSNRLNEALTANKIDKSAVAGVTTLDRLTEIATSDRSLPDIIRTIRSEVDAAKVRVIQDKLRSIGMDPQSTSFQNIVQRITENYEAFKSNPRAFLINEFSRSSFAASTVDDFDKISRAIPNWTAEEIIRGVKTIDGKIVTLDSALKKAGFTARKRESITTALEIAAERIIRQNGGATNFLLGERAASKARELFSDWTLDELENGKIINNERVTREQALERAGLTTEERIRIQEKLTNDVNRERARIANGGAVNPTWRFGADLSPFFTTLEELKNPGNQELTSLIDAVRQRKALFWRDQLWDAVKNTSAGILKNGNISIDGRLVSIKDAMMARGMSARDAQIAQARIQVLAATDIFENQTITRQNTFLTQFRNADGFTNALRGLQNVDDDFFARFADPSMRETIKKNWNQPYESDAALRAERVSSILSTSDLSEQDAVSTKMKGRWTGFAFRNIFESAGIAASVIDVILGVRDIKTGAEKRDALLIAGGVLSVHAGMTGIAAGVLIFRTGMAFAAAVPLSAVSAILGAAATAVAIALLYKEEQKTEQAYGKFLEKYDKYLQEGWRSKLLEEIRRLRTPDPNYPWPDPPPGS
jgi:hypothetical protein